MLLNYKRILNKMAKQDIPLNKQKTQVLIKSLSACMGLIDLGTEDDADILSTPRKRALEILEILTERLTVRVLSADQFKAIVNNVNTQKILKNDKTIP